VTQGPLVGRVAAVAGGATGVGRAIATALVEAGASVGMIGSSGDEASAANQLAAAVVGVTTALDDPAEIDNALLQVEAAHGPLDVAVWAHLDVTLLQPAPVVGMMEAEWDQRAEAPIRSLLWWLQAVHRRLRRGDGRVVVVTPTVALEGAAGLVPFASAAEGQRLLAKSAARRWGREGITVNMVAPSVTALAPALAGTDAGRGIGTLPPTEDPLAEVAAAVVLLCSPHAARITGATIAADGGALMAP
jgi:NAD(P)-dependent dehydrogenase (short-subunit alcohol dehydrogenase family)